MDELDPADMERAFRHWKHENAVAKQLRERSGDDRDPDAQVIPPGQMDPKYIKS